MEFNAIETKYKGYLFRSRLEARWAKVFDELGLKYQYENEGYEVKVENGIVRYLPDFYLEDYDCFVEVKGTDSALKDSSSKISWMIDYCGSPCSKGLLVLGDIPDPDLLSWGNWPMFSYLFWDSGVGHSYAMFDDAGRLVIGTPAILSRVFCYKDNSDYPRTAPEIPASTSTKCQWTYDNLFSHKPASRLKSAFEAARMERFESYYE